MRKSTAQQINKWKECIKSNYGCNQSFDFIAFHQFNFSILNSMKSGNQHFACATTCIWPINAKYLHTKRCPFIVCHNKHERARPVEKVVKTKWTISTNSWNQFSFLFSSATQWTMAIWTMKVHHCFRHEDEQMRRKTKTKQIICG